MSQSLDPMTQGEKARERGGDLIPVLPALERGLLELITGNVLEVAGKLGPTSNLFDAGLDSMAIMQLLLLIEERYGVMLGASDLTRDNFATAAVLAQLVQKRLADKDAGGDA